MKLVIFIRVVFYSLKWKNQLVNGREIINIEVREKKLLKFIGGIMCNRVLRIGV